MRAVAWLLLFSGAALCQKPPASLTESQKPSASPAEDQNAPPLSAPAMEPPSSPPEQEARPALEFTGSPLSVPFPCRDEDLQWAALLCTEEACPIFLELSHAAGQGQVIILTGNFHAAAATMYSVMLRSDDHGRTWREPFERTRGAELDHIQLYDGEVGWISGQTLQPIALDPFFLITSDAGKSWERVALFEEGTPGSILQFEFDSREHGRALIDRGGGELRYEVYETQSGGRAWSIRNKSDEQPKWKPRAEGDWRIHPEAKLFRLQHLEDGRWTPFASFATSAAQCKEQPGAEPKEPTSQTDKEERQLRSDNDAVSEIRLSRDDAKSRSKKKPKP